MGRRGQGRGLVGPPLGSAVPLGPGEAGPCSPNPCCSFGEAGPLPPPRPPGLSCAPSRGIGVRRRKYRFRRRGEEATAMHPRARVGGFPRPVCQPRRGSGELSSTPRGCTLPPCGKSGGSGWDPRSWSPHLSCRARALGRAKPPLPSTPPPPGSLLKAPPDPQLRWSYPVGTAGPERWQERRGLPNPLRQV